MGVRYRLKPNYGAVTNVKLALCSFCEKPYLKPCKGEEHKHCPNFEWLETQKKQSSKKATTARKAENTPQIKRAL